MKKLCLRCQREYAADGVNFCFDDGEPLHPAPDSPGVICPKCETRYAQGASRCARDTVPLVPLTDLAYAQKRVCADCGRAAAENVEFCGHDGARILPRWEIGLVSRTAIPGELEPPERVAAPPPDAHSTLPDRPNRKRGGSAPPDGSNPKAVAMLPALSNDAAKVRPSAATRDAPSTKSVAWFTAAATARPPSADPSSASLNGDLHLGPTFVSRKLIAAVGVAGALCAGAFLFARWAESDAARRARTVQAVPAPPTETTGAPSQPTPPPPANPPATPPALAVAPAPGSTVAPQPSPGAPPLAAKPADDEDDDEPTGARKPKRKAAKAAPEEDPSAALAAALKRAASDAPRPAPTSAASTVPPATPPAEPTPKRKLSRAEAERYFVEAANLYKAGKAQEALRRFRIVAELGPRDGELQGRVLLNMGHISENLGNCKSAKSYYQRATRLIGESSPMRPGLEGRLQRIKESCP